MVHIQRDTDMYCEFADAPHLRTCIIPSLVLLSVLLHALVSSFLQPVHAVEPGTVSDLCRN